MLGGGWPYSWPAPLSCSIAAIGVSLSKPLPPRLPGMCSASPSYTCCAEKGLVTPLLNPPTSLLLPEQSCLSPLHVLATSHPLWDNWGGHCSTNLAPLLPHFTSVPWHPFLTAVQGPSQRSEPPLPSCLSRLLFIVRPQWPGEPRA